jgi:hypothetical protein
MRMGRQPDHVAHRQQGVSTGERRAGAGLQFTHGGGNDDGGG